MHANCRGEILRNHSTLWRNGIDHEIEKLVLSPGWSDFHITQLNDSGMMAGFATKAPEEGEGSEEMQVVLLLPIEIELDVTATGEIDDPRDNWDQYLPGYLGDQPQLDQGDDFANLGYAGPQAMNIIVRGAAIEGADTLRLTLDDVTQYPGWAGNAGDSEAKDFSFAAGSDEAQIDVPVVDGRALAPIFCKDYAAWARIKFIPMKENEPLYANPVVRTLPLDENGDRIADVWQRVEVNRWNMQFGFVDGESDWIDPDDPDTWTSIFGANGEADAELAKSMGPNRDSPAMADDGDGLTALQEYRGFFLDGGPGIESPRHKRLSVSRKDLLVQTMEVADIASLQANGQGSNWDAIKDYKLKDTMSEVSAFYRDTTKGGVIDLYWCRTVFDPVFRLENGDPAAPINYIFLDENQQETGRYTRNTHYAIEGTSLASLSWQEPKPKVSGRFSVYDDRWLRDQPSNAGGDDLLADLVYGAINNHTGHPRKFLAHGRDDDRLRDFIKFGFWSREAVVRVTVDDENLGTHGRHILSHRHSIGPAREVDQRQAVEDERERGAYVFAADVAEEYYGPYGKGLAGHHASDTFVKLLAYAAAHEIGHLLITEPLTGNEHSPPGNGIMSDEPTAKDLNVLRFNHGPDDEIRRFNLHGRISILP